ncbi:MAG: multinuclear nonheme iron-dependent oxidase, partial [Archangium sp.]
MTDDAFREAVRPLLAEGLVAALEWDIDESWGFAPRPVPEWTERLLDLYAEEGALYGHGVWWSVLTAAWQPRQDEWLERLADECHRRPYRHVSEHFGFTAAGPFTRSAMLPLPYCGAAVDIGRDRLERLRAAIGSPAGLEVLA